MDRGLASQTVKSESELERLSAAIYNQRDLIALVGERLTLVRHVAPNNGAVPANEVSAHITNLIDAVERNTNSLRDILDSLAI